MQGVEQRLHEEIQGVRLDMQGVEQRLTRRLDSVDARLDTLRAEMAERFESVDHRFRALELRMTLFENRYAVELSAIRTALDTEIRGELELLKKQVASLSAGVALLNGRLEPLEAAVSSWAASTAGLGEDVKQRFRVMNERLAGIEQRLAA
jgi:chromosome segregation ATPase